MRLWVGDSPLESFRFPSLSVIGVIVILGMLRQVVARRSSTRQSSTLPKKTESNGEDVERARGLSAGEGELVADRDGRESSFVSTIKCKVVREYVLALELGGTESATGVQY